MTRIERGGETIEGVDFIEKDREEAEAEEVLDRETDREKQGVGTVGKMDTLL